jgi:SAM-dependent methyltransferase
VHLAFIAAVNNFRPPNIFQPFSYCELGCGCGKTTSIVAAAYPYSECVGIDMNEEHIRIARRESVGLSNIAFFDMPFEKALDLDLPQFDFIVMHGVWSWISDSARADVIAFVKKFLKPECLFYISYDAMPGWSQLLPFHKIMSIYTQNKDCSPSEKAIAAITYLQFLREHKSAFFENNPDAKLFLQTLERSDVRYIVHELFNRNLRPEYFCDVAADMRKAELTFVGNSVNIDNYHSMMPEQFRKLLGTASDKISMETHRSIIQNDRFRRDIYARCEKNQTEENNAAVYLENFLFGANRPISHLSLETKIGGYTVTLKPDPYLRIFEMLSEDQLTIQEINRRLDRSDDKINDTVENIENCVLTNQFDIFMKKTDTPKESNKIIFTSEYNRRQIIGWKEQYSKIVFVASDVTGDAFGISKKNSLILSAIHRFGLSKEQVVDYAYEFICEDKQKGDNIFGFSDDQDIKYLISFSYNEVVDSLLKRLAALGIVSYC